METFDYIIIGAGSAGCVLANRLSANPGIRVALLEAGGKDTSPIIHMPIGYGKSIYDPKLSWMLGTQAEPQLGGRSIPLPRGKVLGGSSSLNGMIYIRGHQEDYNHWAQLGCTGWGWDDILPYFKRSEHYEGGANDFHGTGGLLNVTSATEQNGTHSAMALAFEQYGLPRNPDFNGACQEGVGFYDATIKSGKRSSTSTAFLKPIKTRKNLTIFTNAQVQKINFKDKVAVSVLMDQKGKSKTLTSTKEIIVSAGAYHSPHLLQLSGIGSGQHLKSIGIELTHDNAEVGLNLQDHFMASMSWSLKPGQFSYNRQLKGLNLVKNLFRYYTSSKGPMAMAAASVGAFVKSDPVLDLPDLQYFALALAGDLEAAKQGDNIELANFDGLTIGGYSLRPESRGWVKATSPDPRHAPEIIHNYLEAKEDQDLTVRAMDIARQVASKPALQEIIDAEKLPGIQAQTFDEKLAFQRELGITAYHPVGTCRMGSDAGAVVNPHLQVNGVSNLRVVDASIMPRLISGNTNATSIAIAEKAADMILNGDR